MLLVAGMTLMECYVKCIAMKVASWGLGRGARMRVLLAAEGVLLARWNQCRRMVLTMPRSCPMIGFENLTRPNIAGNKQHRS